MDCAPDRRKDKALTTMPSRLRDMCGHRRKAFLLSGAYKVVTIRLPRMRQVKSVRGATESLPYVLRTKMSFLSRRGEAALHNRATDHTQSNITVDK